ncbi:hypothetical protein PoB_004823700 [Plakobranchus ocellatus]|uniref:Death domain-containing protein n=1 Tax=Plakobranchus ocellatus TaxID=259542 RepID=A0AAV4BQW5_9GAST|nr:hypothetical protein PoB_004823700 [Plakobranchus ocellatus]
MADEATPRPTTRREPEVLSDASLTILANGVGRQDLKGLELAMFLNIPTTTIVNCINEVTHKFLTTEGTENERASVALKCVLLWKNMTKDTKTRERVKSLEKALREIGKPDIADSFMERHQNNMELSGEMFL